MSPTNVPVQIPLLRWTPLVYRFILRVTRRHGLFTIARHHVRRFPLGQTIETPGGGRLFIPPDPHFFGFLTGLHEEHITRALRDVIEPGSLCIDVGANIGYFSVMMSALAGPEGCVYAFEPESSNYNTLQSNATSVDRRSVPLLTRQAAISDTCGYVAIVHGGESTLHQVSMSTGSDSDGDRVPAISLDSLIGEIPDKKIKLLKIDVEGHELPAIEGAKKLIASKRIEHLIIEVTPGDDAAILQELLAPHARSISCWVDRRWIDAPISSLRNRTDVWVKF